MKLLLLILIILFNAVYAKSKSLLSGKHALEFLEGAIKQFDESFQLSSNFKHEDGGYKTVTVEDLSPNRKLGSATVCTGTSGSVSIPANAAIGQPAITLTYQYSSSVSGACISFTAPFSALNMNYAGNNKAITSPITLQDNDDISSLNGISCNNCWAYSGASISFYLSCTTSACQSYFQAGGGLGFNINLNLDGPDFTLTKKQVTTILAAATTPITLASSGGFTIQANPSATLGVSGSVSAPFSSTSFDASFNTNAAFELYSDIPSLTPTSGAGFGTSISLPKASLKYSEFNSGNTLNVTFDLTMNVEWTISYGPSGLSIGADIITPFTASYGYTDNIAGSRRLLRDQQRSLQSSGCSSTNSLTAAPEFQGFSLTIASVKSTIPTPAPLGEIDISAPSTGSTCLFAKKSLSAGAKAGIAIGVIAFVSIVAAAVYYYYYKKKQTQSLASQDSTSNVPGKRSSLAHRISITATATTATATATTTATK